MNSYGNETFIRILYTVNGPILPALMHYLHPCLLPKISAEKKTSLGI